MNNISKNLAAVHCENSRKHRVHLSVLMQPELEKFVLAFTDLCSHSPKIKGADLCAP